MFTVCTRIGVCVVCFYLGAVGACVSEFQEVTLPEERERKSLSLVCWRSNELPLHPLCSSHLAWRKAKTSIPVSQRAPHHHTTTRTCFRAGMW